MTRAGELQAVLDASVDRTAANALAQAARAWEKAQAMPAARRERYLLGILLDIASTGGAVAGRAAEAYIRALASGDPLLAGIDTTPAGIDTAYVRSSLIFAMQTQTEGLTAAERAPAVQALIARTVDRAVRRHAWRHVNALAAKLGRAAEVVPEAGSCGFCLGRAGQGAMPPYHTSCRCSVKMTERG